MKKDEMIRFANDNPICYMATIENDRPHVRIMKLWFADNSGFYFEVLSPKDLNRQIHANPKVEVCFFNNPKNLAEGRELRISGNIQFISDAAIINKAHKDHQFLEDLGGQSVNDYIEVFKLEHGDAHFWNLKTNILQENVMNHMAF
nr:pyridoxamine 5'-phosphate oxidase family protein [uncultured Carboxylicivirga sp.]